MAKQILKIDGKERVSDFGSAGARRVLRSGRIPCVVYGQRAPFHFTVDSRAFSQLRKKITKTTPIDVLVGDRDMTCLIKAIQENFLEDRVIHLDFYELDRNKEVTAMVKVVLTGTAKGVREGGVLEQVTHEVEVVCLPRDLPEEITIDVTSLEANASLSIKDIPQLSGVKFTQDKEHTIATVKFEKSADDDASAEENAQSAPETEAKQQDSAKK